MSDLEALSLPELEELLVRIRAEIEVRERVPEPAPPRRTLTRTRTRSAAVLPVSDRPAEAETPVEPVAAVEGAVAGVEAESPRATPTAEAVAAAVALPQEAPAEPEPQPPPREAEAGAAPEPMPAPPPVPEAPPIKYMHPSNRNLTWSGEGKPPPWVEIWLYTGGSLYALEVAAEKLRPRPKPAFVLASVTATKSESPGKPESSGKPPRRRRRHHPPS